MQGAILANRSSKDRPSTDFYPTPEIVTIALLEYLNIPKGSTISEPACGDGRMAEVMKSMGYNVISSDLNDMGYGTTGIDYLTASPVECDWIITNPPFKISVDFIKKSIENGKPFALLLKSQYWHSKGRMKLFNDFKPKIVLPLTWRPDFLHKGAPTMECLWTVWGTEAADKTEYALLEKPTNKQ